jgi:hypothetical protein
MSCDVEQAARAYGHYFETLRPDNVDRLHDLAAPDIRFVDPFNDVRGVDQVVRIAPDVRGRDQSFLSDARPSLPRRPVLPALGVLLSAATLGQGSGVAH